MEEKMEDLVNALETTPIPDEILVKITTFLQELDTTNLLEFISENFQALYTLEHWAWKMLSNDFDQWINQPSYIDLYQKLALFNRNISLMLDEIYSDKKATLFIPESTDLIDDIFKQIENLHDDNSPYFTLISLWLDTLSHFLHDHPKFMLSPVIIHINDILITRFIMTEQYKFYLTQLQEALIVQSMFSTKQRFYIKTCSLSIGSYLFCKKQTFPFTTVEIYEYLGWEYVRIILFHHTTVQSWSPEFLSSIAYLITFISACCSWSGESTKNIKTLLSCEEIAYNHVQALINIMGYEPFYQQVQSQRSNDETILIDSILDMLTIILREHDQICFMQFKMKLIHVLSPIVETSKNNRIILCAFSLLGEIVCDQKLKEIKITNNLCEYFFDMLERAWNYPSQKCQRITVLQLLQGFLSLTKIDLIQQKTADINKLPLLIEISDRYPIVFDIMWALSFNDDIQGQIRSNSHFILELTRLKQELDNEHMRTVANGILWNLQPGHDDHAAPEKTEDVTFDIMISYSHKDKCLSKQIYDELIKSGYRVWIDFDQMHGNVMDAMAQAIDHSRTVLICMSEQYRKSNYCRAEAYYAFQRQLKIVPVLLQKHYKPDGWLLFLIGQLLYVDFTKYEFPEAVTMLDKELKASALEGKNVEVVESTHEENVIAMRLPLPLPVSIPSIPSDNILDWNQKEVQEWLVGQNLGQISRLLSDYDGPSLVKLNGYLSNSDSKQILPLMQEDARRRINESLSLVELARFQTLVDQQERNIPPPKQRRKSTTKHHTTHKWITSDNCKMM